MYSFKDKRATVCVQGLGFVGAAMSVVIAMARNEEGMPLYNVIGIDRPDEAGKERARKLNEGIFPFDSNDEHLLSALKECHSKGNLIATTDNSNYSQADIVVVDINLDVYYREDGFPYLDLSLFKSAMTELGCRIKEGTLVIVETTVPPGTSENVVFPILKSEMKKRGLNEENLYVAHSYERVMPGADYYDSIANFWRVYSGVNDESAEKCEAFLKSIISTKEYPLTRLESTTATETAKVLENSYRAVTIALMDEWGRFAEAVGVDLFSVIDAIRMRPTHCNMRQPGFGVGGYCLTKDPYFAMLSSEELFHIHGMEFPFSTMAVRINKAMPIVSVDKIESILGTLKNKKILVLGVSYRQDVGDTRYSPTEIFAREAIARGADLDYQDPLVDHWPEMQVQIDREIPDFRKFDVIVFCVAHKEYKELSFNADDFSEGTLVFDANNVLNKRQREELSAIRNIRVDYIGRGKGVK